MKLTLLTPCSGEALGFLPELDLSVQEARVKLAGQGVKVSWSICGDGVAIPESIAAENKGMLHKQQGVSAARNEALKNADQSELVYPIDADDLIDAEGLSKLTAEAIRRDTAFLASNRETLTGKTLEAAWTDREKHYQEHQYGEEWCAKKKAPHANSVLYRRVAIEQAGGWTMGMHQHEDVMLLAKINQQHQGLWLPISVTRYRLWPGQTIAGDKYKKNKREICLYISKQINQAREQAGLDPVEERISTSGSQWQEENLRPAR